MIKEIKAQISWFVKNFTYMIALVISAAAGYAYQLTHGTCGIDDISIDLYFEKGLGVAIGRWPYYLVNKVLPVAEYRPFIGDFITLLLLMLSAIVWCGLIRMAVKRDLPIWCYIVFSAMFLNYSMIAEVFVFYLQNGLGFVYLLTGLALFGAYYILTNQVERKENIGIRIGMILCLTIAISFYESAANLYLSGMLLMIYIDMQSRKNTEFSFKHIMGTMVFTARYLVYAMICRRVIRTVLMKVFGIMPYTFYRSASLSWLFKGGIGRLWQNLSTVFEELFENYFTAGLSYFPIALFVGASFLFLLHLIWKDVRKKELLTALVGMGFYMSMFLLSFVQGGAVTYRACQIFSIFIGLVLMAVTEKAFKLNGLKKTAGLAVVMVVIVLSAYDLNKWFELDYRKTEYEMSVLKEIAKDLQDGGYNITEKPLVVVGDFELPDEMVAEYGYSQNRNSIIHWSVRAFAMHYGYNVPIRQFYEYLGYSFIWADQELCREVFEKYYPLDKVSYDIDPTLEAYTQEYGTEEEYPNKGYIEETERYIVVKL